MKGVVTPVQRVNRKTLRTGKRGSLARILWIAGGLNLMPALADAATITFQTEAGRPRIVSSTPSHLAANILTNTNIRVTFDQAMNPATLNTTNVKLVNLSTGQVHPSWTAAAVSTTSDSFQVKLYGSDHSRSASPSGG